MKRRQFLAAMGAFAVGGVGFRYWPDEGIWNPCLPMRLPKRLAQHPVVARAWEGIDASRVWDVHTHLIGTGDSNRGIWLNPNMQSLLSPIQYAQMKFYLNAACPASEGSIDTGYVDRLKHLMADMPRGVRLMLLAFDYHHDEQGRRIPELSPFYTPNEYAAAIAQEMPERFEWIASIHPYREDCVEALEKAVAQGARAVKWLPGAMRIDPSSPLCDRFYSACVRLNVPILIHTGDEHAVHVEGLQALGNPLLVRRALDQGVRMVLAHCASIGTSMDTDKGPSGPEVHNFELFKRLMAESSYQGLLFGDLSAVTQVNRDMSIMRQIVENQDWHSRLLNGSDYPLPGVMPVFSLESWVGEGYLEAEDASVLSEIRQYNALLFDFLLKRLLKFDGQQLSTSVFETRNSFDLTI
jgi:mannonate dehydratase